MYVVRLRCALRRGLPCVLSVELFGDFFKAEGAEALVLEVRFEIGTYLFGKGDTAARAARYIVVVALEGALTTRTDFLHGE